MSRKVVKVERNGQVSISYELEDGTRTGFMGEPEFCTFVMNAWEKRDCCGFTVGQTPMGKEVIIYIVPTTDGISLLVQPKTPLKIIHAENDNHRESMIQITLEDK